MRRVCWRLVYVIVTSLAAAEAGVGAVMVLEDEPLTTIPTSRPTVPGKWTLRLRRVMRLKLRKKHLLQSSRDNKFRLVQRQKSIRDSRLMFKSKSVTSSLCISANRLVLASLWPVGLLGGQNWLKPNSITLASSELAPNMFGASSELVRSWFEAEIWPVI